MTKSTETIETKPTGSVNNETEVISEQSKAESENKINWIQKIYFGPPGTGKSHKAKNAHNQELETTPDINHKETENTHNEKLKTFRTVFHPEYGYGDFMGRVLPLTEGVGNQLTYKYRPGHLLKALAEAYKQIINLPSETKTTQEHVLFIIDEINRGNTASIFGSIFQLLDRDDNGWSSYDIDLSEMEKATLLEMLELEYTKENFYKISCANKVFEIGDLELKELLKNGKIKFPYNFSIIGTMNTSDDSIYMMDTAFKRRWEWEYVGIGKDTNIGNINLDDNQKEIHKKWSNLCIEINKFIGDNSNNIRNSEGKLIGHHFATNRDLNDKSSFDAFIKNKFMFYLWDTVFSRDKKPLLIKCKVTELNNFGEFQEKAADFIMSFTPQEKNTSGTSND